jgi:hypothetical protein
LEFESQEKPSIQEIATAYRQIHSDLEGESDRAAAVLGAAYLDELLKELLRHACVNSDIAAGFRNLASRIDAAFSMGLIPELVRHDLHIVREIRNKFAHESRYRTFAQASAKEALMKLELVKAIDDADLAGYSDIERRLHRQAVSSLRLELAYRIREVARPTPPNPASPVYVLVAEGKKAPSSLNNPSFKY